MTRRTWIATLAASALAVGGCRSDGGIDRADCASELEFASSRIAEHTREDVRTTRETIASIPRALARSVSNSLRDMQDSWHLYLENHEPR
jgi:hypothetical protein